MAMLFVRSNMHPIDMKPLINVGGRRGKSMFHANFTMPKEVKFFLNMYFYINRQI